MQKGYSIKEGVIIINRELTELDKFVRDFLDILKKHSDYLVVSGYVSISSGRTRATEDVDILVPIPTKEKFSTLLKDLQKNKFWCYQGDTAEEIYPYLLNHESIRFARENEIYPNIEFVPIDETRKLKWFEFQHPQKVRVQGFEFKIPPVEFEILYKEIILAGDKDKKDALHLRTFFADILDENKFKEYNSLILNLK